VCLQPFLNVLAGIARLGCFLAIHSVGIVSYLRVLITAVLRPASAADGSP
jgi:hypothetical protein